MLKNILDLEGVAVLDKKQQKEITGGRRIRNLQGTGNIMVYNGGVYACECTWEVKEGLFGSWQQQTGPCPAQTMESLSCVPE
ncbi:hypothetical protein [Corallibacter vietnamensis]